MSFPTKDKDDILDYVWDWASWLAGDTISAAVVLIEPTGLVLETQSNTTTTVTAWFSGGAVDVTYALTCRITTVGGRRKDNTQKLKIKES